MKLIFLNMFHLQTNRNGVHQKGHWGYCNDDLDLGLFVRNADEEEGGDCPIPKPDKPSPKPPTTTTLKPKRREPSAPKSQTRKPTVPKPPTRKPTTPKPLQDYEDYYKDYYEDYDYDYHEPSSKTTTPKPQQRKTATHTSPKTKGTLI
jgi:hypothetical protein